MFTTSCFRGRLYRKHLVKKFRTNVNMANFIVNKCPNLSKSDKSIGAVTQELLPSLLPREIGLVRVTGLFQDKFANEKYPWLRQKEERNRP